MTFSNFPSNIPELMCYSVVEVCSNAADYAELYLNIDSIVYEGGGHAGCLDGINRALNLSNAQLFEMMKFAIRCAEDRFNYGNWIEKISRFLEA